MQEINFVETDTEAIISEMVETFEAEAGRTLAPADPWKVAILWAANVIVQERNLINQSARKNLLQYANDEYMDALAENFHDCERLEATAAAVTMQFTISEAQAEPVKVPKGTRTTANDGIYFETETDLIIAAGETTGTVTAHCMTAGTAGNGYEIGQIKTLVDIFNYFSSCTNTDVSSGGSDRETDAEFYERIKLSNDTWSTAGPTGAYIYYAKSVSNDIADVKPVSDTPGEVIVYVLLNGGELPGEALLQDVKKALSAEKVRPFTDHVEVKAPEVESYNINLTYYISQEDAAEEDAIKERVAEAIEQYKLWQGEKMGRDINPSELIFTIRKAGAKRMEVTEPAFKAITENKIAKVSAESVLYGGLEDE